MMALPSCVCFFVQALLHDKIPRYVLRNLDGAHDGARLFARCLRLLDAKLFTHLSSKIPDLSIFSLRYILTLFANSRPLSEVLKLWDAILAVGVHFNILLLCSKLMLMRETLLKEKRGAK
jgi:cell cycle arrest protein BUB2